MIKPTKTTVVMLLVVLVFFIPVQAAQNASVPTNTSHATDQTTTVEEAIETVFLIGIILSPLSFILAIVALWVALKNRRKTYTIK